MTATVQMATQDRVRQIPNIELSTMYKLYKSPVVLVLFGDQERIQVDSAVAKERTE